MTQEQKSVDKVKREVLDEFNKRFDVFRVGTSYSSNPIEGFYPIKRDAFNNRDVAAFISTAIDRIAYAAREEGVKEERERMRAEVMRILDIQHSGVRQDTDFEKGYTTAYKNMSAHLLEK